MCGRGRGIQGDRGQEGLWEKGVVRENKVDRWRDEETLGRGSFEFGEFNVRTV